MNHPVAEPNKVVRGILVEHVMARTRLPLCAGATIAVLISAGCTGRERPLRMGEERVIFTGTVEKVEPRQHDDSVYPVGVDPRFLLVVNVNSIEQNKSSPITPGRSINFTIHSPARLFGIEDPTGKKFRFKATWVWAPEAYKGFSWMDARPATLEKE